MRILWNSDVMQETLERLQRADQGLENGARQSNAVLTELAEANAAGDDRALAKIREQFDACERKLNALAAELKRFERAARRADDEFSDAEQNVSQLMDNLEPASDAPVGEAASDSVRWEGASFAVMPEFRAYSRLMPQWLLSLTEHMDEEWL